MELEKQIEILKEWHKGAEMSLPIMSSADIERFLHWLEDYKQLKADYIDLDNRLRTANTEIDRLRSVSSWIPCSERLPEDNVNVLGNITITVNTNIAKPKQRTIFAKHDRVFGWTTANGYPIVGKITHWMPIPEPPKGE